MSRSRRCSPQGDFPEEYGAGSFLPESFARIRLFQVCTFGALNILALQLYLPEHESLFPAAIRL